MLKIKNTAVFYIIILAYIFMNAYVLLYERSMFYAFNLVPFVLLILFLAIMDIEKVMYVMIFSAPLSVGLKELGLTQGIDLSMPCEPLMAGIMLIYFLNEINHGVTPSRILRHPVTIILFIQLGWIVFTTITSQLPVISIKFLIARLWFVTSCYFMTVQLFRKKGNMIRFMMVYATALCVVCIITTVKHASYGFDEKTADWIVSPFYNDHTAYGCALAMFIPVFIGFLFMTKLSFWTRLFSLGVLTILLVSIVISYARAGWLGLFAAAGVLATLLLRIKFRTILVTIGAGLILFLSFQSEIFMMLGRNTTDSDGDFTANLESMTNISTDVSNLERINRWNSALRMFKEKPLVGFGPGTYQFLYAPFQKSNEKTYISTNFGDHGNAHSEYLGPLSEQGLPGALIVVALILSVLFMGYRLVYRVKDRTMKIFTISVLLGLCTYFVHGFLNNFLDTDKASVPFWGFIAMLVCIDVYYKDEPLVDNGRTEEVV
ncbi:MAG: O-antigen ligase family protein [Bacteroidetes bacterium]|nr:O-antigen ligase family protein [Bacteroidota bacterium]